MRIGIHTSTSGSLERAALKAAELGANTFQIFSASPRMWRTKQPDREQIRLLRAARDKHDLTPLVIHDSYLINLASPPSEIREKSIDAFTGEIERAILIGADYLVAHPGNYKGLTTEGGILNVAEAVALAWRGVNPDLQKGASLTILLENTAGAGAQLGGKFEELASLRQLISPYLDIPVGFCLDTCHCYVSGIDLSRDDAFEDFVRSADSILGWNNVPVIHSNDTKMALGSHCDRHAHIGTGCIGDEGFRRLLNHRTLREKTFILETPVDEPGDDLRNVNALKALAPQPQKQRKASRSRRALPH